MVNSTKLCLLLLASMLTACGFNPDIHRLKYYDMPKTAPDSMPFKTNGFYYKVNELGEPQPYINIFYNNGMRYSGGSSSEYLDWIADTSDTLDVWLLRDCLWCWGVYTIASDTIKGQYFCMADVGFKRTINEYWGIIENDTTLRFFRYFHYGVYGNIAFESQHDKIMRFKEFPVKPDSMNILFEIRNSSFPELHDIDRREP